MRSDITVSVTELARFCHRSGDIDHRFTPSPTGPEGIAGHQKLYRERASTYKKEYAVETQHRAHGIKLCLRGRADGYDPEAALVEEIKTCRIDPQAIPTAVQDLHLAQGRLYAAMIAHEADLEGLNVRLTWLNIDTDETSSRDQFYGQEELTGFLDESLDRFCRWLARVEQLREHRNASGASLPFPHGEFRKGQREIAELTYKCIDQSAQLMIEAPTGIGKTAAVLYPAVKALATAKHDKVVYVTSKTVGRLAAEDALSQFRAAGLKGSALTLSAKERVCFSPGKACHGDDCPFARGYYDKLPAAMSAALDSPTLRREDIECIAREHAVCPYELALDMLPWVDIVIADLHYVYSLYGLLAPLMEEGQQRWSVLLDEAHNLPSRARDMFSANLHKAALMAGKRDAPPLIAKALDRINRRMLALTKTAWNEQGFHSMETPPEALLRALAEGCADIGHALGQDATLLVRSPTLQEFYFAALHFLRVAEEWGPEYRCQLSRGSARQSLAISLNCLDPSRLLAARQQRAHSVTAFSATLSPLPWARTRLGLEEEAVCSRAVSPFDKNQLQVQLATDIDTRYRSRQASLPALAARIERWLHATAGNCIVYFPSYSYLQSCLELIGPTPGARTLWRQTSAQSEPERDELLQLLRERRDVAAFCILGGVWGEGIDLPGEQLCSVVVVGVGMPQVNRDTRELQAHFQRTVGDGFEFTFLYPGMQKVAQGLGRVVRTDRDRGTALLIDPRYAEPAYQALLPPWWHYRQSAE
ncbi:MAG: helicase C-terminal domain-containing protein [Halioglobus sp.]